MRLATLQLSDGTVAAAEHGGRWHPVHGAQGARFADVGALLRSGPDWRDRAASPETEPVEGATLRPVLDPGAVVCVGVNYLPHVIEMGREVPDAPTLFSKLPRALTDPGVTVVLPAASRRVDYEGELVVVIGEGGRAIDVADAWERIAGVTLMNDVSMRDFQRRTIQWFAGKTWERCTPVGPALVTVDELHDVPGLEIETRVNGEVRQSARIGDLIFGIPELVADISQIVALRPGDLIATGTPGGVGDAMDPPRYLDDGDVVEVSVTNVGTLRNTFVRA